MARDTENSDAIAAPPLVAGDVRAACRVFENAAWCYQAAHDLRRRIGRDMTMSHRNLAVACRRWTATAPTAVAID